MFFSLIEIIKWLGLTTFEIFLHIVSIEIFSVFAVLKHEGHIEWNWWVVFSPLFICDGVACYFAFIVFIRMYLERNIRSAAFRTLWSLTFIILLFVFKLLLCQKLERQVELTYAVVLSPLYILLNIIMMRACQK